MGPDGSSPVDACARGGRATDGPFWSQHPTRDGSRIPQRGAQRRERCRRQYLNTRLSEGAAEDLATPAVPGARHPPARTTRHSSATRPRDRADPLSPTTSSSARSPGRGHVDHRCREWPRGRRNRSGCSRARRSNPFLPCTRRSSEWADAVLPRFLTDTRVCGIRLVDWLAVLLGLPVLYLRDRAAEPDAYTSGPAHLAPPVQSGPISSGASPCPRRRGCCCWRWLVAGCSRRCPCRCSRASSGPTRPA